MPIYEYSCECGHVFEALVRPGEAPGCPECGSTRLERLLSTPAVRSTATHGKAMRAAGRRDKSLATDRMKERMRYEDSHDRHG
jgi:putative FmdB family regulatory protein